MCFECALPCLFLLLHRAPQPGDSFSVHSPKLESPHDPRIIVRLESVLKPCFGVLELFCDEFSPDIRAIGDGLSLHWPRTRSGRLILLRILLGGDIRYTRVCKVVPFRARNGRCGGSLPDNFPGIIRSSLVCCVPPPRSPAMPIPPVRDGHSTGRVLAESRRRS